MKHIAPLPASFMLAAIIGFLVSATIVGPISRSWGLAFSIIFVLMFVASLVSMSYAPSPGGMRDIRIEGKRRKRRRGRRKR